MIGNGVTANITLNQVEITFQDGVLDETDETNAGTTALALGSGATLHLALIGISNLQSGFGRAGIYVPENATINIQGSNGTLNVTGGFRGAGIGGDIYSNAGTINIAGGTINATSNSDGAAIGGGHANDTLENKSYPYGGFQAINITGGTVTAKTSGNAAGIGTGCWSKIDTGTIHIENAVVYASTAGGYQDNAAIGRGIIPSGASTGMTISIANSFVCAKNIKGAPVGTATITNSLVSGNEDSSQSQGSCTVTNAIDIPNGTMLTIPARFTLVFGGDVTNRGTIMVFGTLEQAKGTFTNDGGKVFKEQNGIVTGNIFVEPSVSSSTGDFTVTGGIYGASHIYANNTLTILSGTALTISTTNPTTTDKIVVQSGVCANITLAGVSIVLGGNTCPLNMDNAGQSTVRLAEGTVNTLDGSASTDGAPGILVPNSKKLTIEGPGKLVAKGSASWPGIGRNGDGNIEIKSGVIEAVGGGICSRHWWL